MTSSGSGCKIFPRISSKCGSCSRLHSWSYSFSIIHNDLPDNVICDTAIYADDSTLYSIQLELASEDESDLRDTVDQDKKWLVDLSAGKTQLVLFDFLIAMVLLM